MSHSKEANKWTEIISEEAQISDLLDKAFETTVLNILKDIKENKNKEWKEISNVWIKWECQQRGRNYLKEAKRNSGTENYNNRNGKFPRIVQQYIWLGRRISELEDETIELLSQENIN